MSDWRASVEGRLTDLRDDYRELRKWGFAAVGLLLAGGGYAAWDLKSEMSDVKVAVGGISGKIDMLLKGQNANTQTSDRAGQTGSVHQGTP